MQLEMFPDPNGVRTKDIKLTAKQRARESAHFAKVRNAEHSYAVALRKIARHVGEIIRAFPPGEAASVPELQSALSRYADILLPWARSAAARMIAEVARRDERAWFKTANAMGLELRAEIRAAPIGDEVRRILESQVDLIRSIPLEAAQRVQDLTRDYVTGGRRYQDLVPLVLSSGEVTVVRANLIARTEVAKAASALTQARAKFVGSEGYIWRTVRDRDVRPIHKRLEGSFHQWDDPPIAETNGTRHHPGEFPNCRCFAEPVLPAVIT